MRHLIDIMDLSITELDEMIEVAKDIIANPQEYSYKCAGKKLGTLFFEPSTRYLPLYVTFALSLIWSML